MPRPPACVLLFLLLTTCAAKPFTLAPPGETSVGALKFDVAPGWNMGRSDPTALFPTGTWTCDGPLLDRFIVYAGVDDNQPFVNDRKGVKRPRFRAGMSSDAWVNAVVATLASLFGDDPAQVTTSNLRPHNFGTHAGVLFDVAIAPVTVAYYKAMIGGFVADEKLYLVMYLGADPYYYDKHRAEAEQMIASARL